MAFLCSPLTHRWVGLDENRATTKVQVQYDNEHMVVGLASQFISPEGITNSDIKIDGKYLLT